MPLAYLTIQNEKNHEADIYRKTHLSIYYDQDQIQRMPNRCWEKRLWIEKVIIWLRSFAIKLMKVLTGLKMDL